MVAERVVSLPARGIAKRETKEEVIRLVARQTKQEFDGTKQQDKVPAISSLVYNVIFIRYC